MKVETILRKLPRYQDSIETESLSDSELFVRKKLAEFISWEKRYHDYLVEYGLWPKVKITAEIVMYDKAQSSAAKYITKKE